MGEFKKMIRVSGHTLLHEGDAYNEDGKRKMYRPKLGHGKCSCGEVSPLMSSNGARKRWHRLHKVAILNANPAVGVTRKETP